MNSLQREDHPHDRGGVDDAAADAVLAAVAATIDGIAATVGPSCEVLVHDYRTPDRSVIAVAGDVTGRRAGDPMSEIGRRMLAAGDGAEPDLNYRTRTPDGRLLKSSTMPIHDGGGRLIGALCLNIDVSAVQQMQEQLSALMGSGGATDADPVTEFPSNFDAALDDLLRFESRARGKELSELTKAERRELLARIDRRGLLEARGAVTRISSRLGVSRAAVYQDLKERHDIG